MSTIDLTGLDKAAVLAALYNTARPQGMGFIHYDPTPMTVEEAEKLLHQITDFDYLKGRVMKVDLSGYTLNSQWFDRDNGEGTAKAAINSLRETGDPNSKLIQKIHSDSTYLSAINAGAHLKDGSEMTTEGDWAVLNLGLSDMEEHLRPKIDAAKEHHQDK